MKAKQKKDRLVIKNVWDGENFVMGFYLNDKHIDSEVTLFFGKKGESPYAVIDGRRVEDVYMEQAE